MESSCISNQFEQNTFVIPDSNWGLPAYHGYLAALGAQISGTPPPSETSGYATQEVLRLNARVKELEALNPQVLSYIVSTMLQTNSPLQTCAKQAEQIVALLSLLDAKDEEIKRLNSEMVNYHLPCNERLAHYEALLRKAHCDYDALADAVEEDERTLRSWMNRHRASQRRGHWLSKYR